MRSREAEVFDLGYQRYTGLRQGRNQARLALLVNGVRTLLGIGRGGKAKILPVLLFISVMLPAVVFVIILSFLGDGGGDFVPGPGDYFGIVYVVLVLFGAIMAPELLGPDRRDNVLPLYLVRPITTMDYLAARLLAFGLVVLALVYAGQAVLQVGIILTASDPAQHLRDNWLDIPRILLVGGLITLFITAAAMAVSAFTTRRAVAAAVVIGAYILVTGVAESLTIAENCIDQEAGVQGEFRLEGVECDYLTGSLAPYLGLLSLDGVTANLTNMVFDIPPPPNASIAVAELPRAWPIGAYVVLTALPLALLWNRYRRVRL